MTLSSPPPAPSVAIIGAGIAGLACAGALSAAGWRVQVFDKSRGAGGRAATRRAEGGGFDHGAQYFTVRDPRFARVVSDWQAESTAAPWVARVVRIEGAGTAPVPVESEPQGRRVGTPGMSALGRALARGLPIAFECPIVQARRFDAGWILTAGDGGGMPERVLPQPWDWLVCAAPAPQSASLLATDAPDLAAAVAARTMLPCWAVMVDIEPCADTGWDAAFVDDPRLAWAARESSRPGRAPGGRWVLHAGARWSLDHLEQDAGEVATRLLAAFREITGIEAPARAVRAHRWRYARPDDALPALPQRCLLEPSTRAAACGDWASAGRIEDAWLSGHSLALRLLAGTDRPA